MEEYVTLACITQNRIKNMQRLIPKVIDWVDKVVVVDSFSVDGTKEWLENYSPKIIVTQRQWDDSFANQYNEYLKHIDQGWILICDDDEIPSQALLKTLKPMIRKSMRGERFSIVEYRSQAMRVENDIIVEDTGPNPYWRQIFFKWMPKMRYVIDLHQALMGTKSLKYTRRDEVYYHLKSNEDLYRNACRNWWIAGIWLMDAKSGIFSEEWHEFKRVVLDAYPDVKVFGDFNAYMVKGNINQKVKDYIIKVKDLPDEIDKDRNMNELRAYYKYYFDVLHPEEMVKE